jgi:hypothetical protein
MNKTLQHKTPGGVTGKGFTKGDPRINRAGKPKGFDEVRALAQKIANEDVVWADGNTITRAELLLRRWSRSKNPKVQRLFVEIAFGPVPPTKVEANVLEPRTALILRWPHELDREPAPFGDLPQKMSRATRSVA